jgi:hypothetical protein
LLRQKKVTKEKATRLPVLGAANGKNTTGA